MSKIASVINDDPTLLGKRELLEPIPGIGERVSTTLLGELPQLTEFRNGKPFAALVGVCPREFRSGTSVKASWLSKLGADTCGAPEPAGDHRAALQPRALC